MSGDDVRALVLARNEANRSLLASVLGGEGLSVVPAGDLDDARKEAAPLDGLGLALIDIGGLTRDVWELCEDLSEADVPVVVVTATRTEEVQEQSTRSGVRTVLEKPLRKANLQALVETLTDDD